MERISVLFDTARSDTVRRCVAAVYFRATEKSPDPAGSGWCWLVLELFQRWFDIYRYLTITDYTVKSGYPGIIFQKNF
ncbi:MAG: hypothetical protein J6U30_05870, partial [Oscillospiraceae bacterium]|nr:hypothetical protein [Oscillospiraceae bacterium]